MKTQFTFILAILILSFVPLRAQNWDPFPQHQQCIYASYLSYDTLLDITIADTIITEGPIRKTYFHYENTMQNVGDCLDEISESILTGTFLNSQSSVMPYLDSIISTNDSALLFGTNWIDSLLILQHPAINQTWFPIPGNDNVYLKCVFSGTQPVLGITDSIKTFRFYKTTGTFAMSDFDIRLSKTYGLISFPDFDQLVYDPETTSPVLHQLIGLSNAAEHIGYSMPGYDDYFPSGPGDILVWEDFRYNPDPFNYIDVQFYYKDSILEKDIYPDSIIYIFDRWQRDTDGIVVFVPAVKNVFNRTGFEPLINAVPGWLGMGANLYYNGPGDNSLPVWNHIYSTFSPGEDTVVNHVFSGGEYSWDTINCNYESSLDFGVSFSINNAFGITSHGYSFNDYSDIFILIGSVINGVASGETDFYTLGNQDAVVRQITMFPNPANNSIAISLNEQTKGTVSVFNNLGEMVMKLPFNGQSIDISKLEPGIYLLRLETNQNLFTGRFVKN